MLRTDNINEHVNRALAAIRNTASLDRAAAAKSYSIDDLERIFGSGTFGAETAVLLQQVQDANRRVTETLNRSNAYRKLSDKIRGQIETLREYKGLIDKVGEDGKLSVKDLSSHTGKDVAEVAADLKRLDFRLNEDGAVGTQPDAPTLTVDSNQAVYAEYDVEAVVTQEVRLGNTTVTSDKLDLEIKRLEGEIHRVDGLREAEGLRIQEVLQLKQRLVTLATNILQTTHKSLEAITNNTRA